MRTLLQRYFVADATQKRRSMSQATCFLISNNTNASGVVLFNERLKLLRKSIACIQTCVLNRIKSITFIQADVILNIKLQVKIT